MEILGVVVFLIVMFANIAKKAGGFGNVQDAEDEAEFRETVKNIMRKRRQAAKTAAESSAVYQEGKGSEGDPYHVPTPSTVTESAYMEMGSQNAPNFESAEGSPYRAHGMDRHKGSLDECEQHSEPVSTEGESRSERMQRIKERREARRKMDERYDAEKVDKADIKSEKSLAGGIGLKSDRESLLQGILYSEILGKPKGLRK